MKIERLDKPVENLYLTVTSLNSGDVFVYDSDVKTIYMKTDSDNIIDLETGELVDYWSDDELHFAPVQKILAKLVVYDEK